MRGDKKIKATGLAFAHHEPWTTAVSPGRNTPVGEHHQQNINKQQKLKTASGSALPSKACSICSAKSATVVNLSLEHAGRRASVAQNICKGTCPADAQSASKGTRNTDHSLEEAASCQDL